MVWGVKLFGILFAPAQDDSKNWGAAPNQRALRLGVGLSSGEANFFV
jgi:hypothetical protein